MNIDVVLGSASDKKQIEKKYKLSSFLILTVSPLVAINQILGKVGSDKSLENLRIFIFSENVPMSQLARLSGSFAPNGRLEVINLASNLSGESLQSIKASGLIQDGGQQGGGGFNFNIGGNAFRNQNPTQSQHLSSLLNVPVSFINLT